jgi:acetyl esterase/lipase
MSITGMIFKASCKRSDDKRDAGLSTPADIVRYDDIVYGPNRRWNVLDVYRPRDVGGKLPVIVSVHGGGWVYGDKERYQYYCMSLAQQGFAVVNFTYGLAPRFKFPSQLEDTNRVFSFVLEQAERFGFDTGRVFGVGDSAGAHLLALFCCLCTNPDYAVQYPFRTPAGFAPTAVALNCGVYEIKIESNRDPSARLMADLLPDRGTDEELRRISPLYHVTDKFPPALVMTCEGDFLAPAAQPMVRKLESLGVPVTYKYYGDKNHVLGHVFHCNMYSADAAQCNRDECDFFRGFC